MVRVVLAGVAAIALLGACTQHTDGTATDVTASATGTTSAAETTSAPATTGAAPATSSASPSSGMPDFGVVETTRRPLEPATWTCPEPAPPAGGSVAFLAPSALDAPEIAIALPAAWTSEPAPDGSALTLTGPDGTTGVLTVTPTDLGPAEAFETYSDDRTAGAPISSVSVLPAELCGYSGQKMLGMLSGGAGPAVEYRDRIAHVWTGGPSYLVAIRVEGPQGGEAVSAAADVILSDFGIRTP
ncbi:hypothetical protein [Mycolicibacterium sp. F2034L]|uniref:hypothetical protein n=1 Tax=Mycolicibacterium sp. F2034L TaxID=2926422 RepID=UPI001FF5DB67|nr:hypothetical protein [Mycolicibacterium sp. F2034L]MCK0173686.1 hypothetical protein [Mycolicibacterium sp. F2034L]